MKPFNKYYWILLISLISFNKNSYSSLNIYNDSLGVNENIEYTYVLHNQIIKTYNKVFNAFLSEKKYDKALHLYKQYIELSYNFSALKKDKLINKLKEKYEIEKTSNEIELLRKDEEIREEKISLQNTWIIILLNMAVVITALAITIYFQKKKQYLSEVKLVEKNIKLLNKQTSSENINRKIITHSIQQSKYIISENQKDDIIKLLNEGMNVEKLYSDPEITLKKLSERININTTYLSKIINDCFNKNFNTYINEYRIKESMIMLINNREYTIEGIAKEVGFNSKSSFNIAFKKYTGVTPSVFIKSKEKLDND